MIKNIVVISDTHLGCQLAVCKKIRLDGGGHYNPSRLQKTLYAWWNIFWNEWVPEATKGEDFILVHNGDIIDGIHHKSTTQISHNINSNILIIIPDQSRQPENINKPPNQHTATGQPKYYLQAPVLQIPVMQGKAYQKT